MIRTKNKPKTPALPSGTMGGYMPDPPKDCTAPRIEYNPKEKRSYVHPIFCRDCKNVCQRRKDFLKEWEEYRKWEKDKNGHPTSS